jgi:hypothetical protein
MTEAEHREFAKAADAFIEAQRRNLAGAEAELEKITQKVIDVRGNLHD